jgi:hypothetical protein
MDKEPLDKEKPADSGRSFGSALDDLDFRPLGRRVRAKKGVVKTQLVVRRIPPGDAIEEE